MRKKETEMHFSTHSVISVITVHQEAEGKRKQSKLRSIMYMSQPHGEKLIIVCCIHVKAKDKN